MIAPSESNTSSYGAERRSCGRQRVLFSSVVLSEGNCGRVLNISPNGLALQTDTELIGKEFPFRFKFSPSLAWVEAKGRVAWRNDSKNVVGIEFIGLTDEVQRQIKTWMDWKKESTDPPKTSLASTNAPLNEEAGTGQSIVAHEQLEIDTERNAVFAPDIVEGVNVGFEDHERTNQIPEFDFPPPQSVDLRAGSQKPPEIRPSEYDFASPEAAPSGVEDQSLPSIATAARDSVEIQEFPRSDEVKATRGSGTQVKLVGLALLIIFLVCVIFFRRNHAHSPLEGLQNSTTVRAPRQPTRPDQTAPTAATPSTPPTKSSGAVSPAASPALTHASASNETPGAHGPAFVLQVAAMLHQENANALKTTLRNSNFPAFVTKLPTEKFHHVLVGPFNSASAAMEAQTKLEQLGYKPIRTEWKASSH
jgi:cell division septation protein DedD